MRLLGESEDGSAEREFSPSVQPIPSFEGGLRLSAQKGDLSWPVEGRVAKRFGVERDPRFGTRTVQKGIEIDAYPEVDVKAVHPGRVVFADHFVGHGLLVILDHGNREHTLYGRLGELLVAPGDEVAAGTLLGLLPDTRLTRSGLHFEVRVQGKAQDPLNWLVKP